MNFKKQMKIMKRTMEKTPVLSGTVITGVILTGVVGIMSMTGLVGMAISRAKSR